MHQQIYLTNKGIAMEITKREVLFSIVIISIMLLFGFVISDNINDSLMNEQQKYNTALQVNKDKDLFQYGMRTNVGNAFVYGNLKALDTVSYEELSDDYSYVKKVKERYTRHTRTVTKTKTVNGKTKTYTDTEVYWTWDEIDSWSKKSKKISFLDVEFEYESIPFPASNYITTIRESSRIRYVYYGTGKEFKGTLYTQLKNNTINETKFYPDKTIEETLDYLKSNVKLVLFWTIWIILIIAAVIIFYYIDNRWLEDK